MHHCQDYFLGDVARIARHSAAMCSRSLIEVDVARILDALRQPECCKQQALLAMWLESKPCCQRYCESARTLVFSHRGRESIQNNIIRLLAVVAGQIFCCFMHIITAVRTRAGGSSQGAVAELGGIDNHGFIYTPLRNMAVETIESKLVAVELTDSGVSSAAGLLLSSLTHRACASLNSNCDLQYGVNRRRALTMASTNRKKQAAVAPTSGCQLPLQGCACHEVMFHVIRRG